MIQKVKNIILIVLGGLSAAAVLVLFACGSARASRMECRDVKVCVKDSTVNHFVSENDVKALMRGICGSVKGVYADSLDLGDLERKLEGKSVIKGCEAYFTRDGVLNIDITQRTPAVRFQNSSNGWYADAEGYVFPLQRSYTSRVQVVDGDFPVKVERGFKGQVEDPGQREWLMRVVSITEYMERSGWKDRISQIHVSSNGEVLLVPSSGKEKFIFGQPVKIESKFRRMEKYYRMILPLGKGYSSVDLRFDGQIVCK